MIFESESGVVMVSPSGEVLERVLIELDGKENSYAYLTASDQSYIQVGGGPNWFTVECRVIKEGGNFRHFKAARGLGDDSISSLTIGGSMVSVTKDQMLSLREVVVLFQAFGSLSPMDDLTSWVDITEMFR